MLVIGVNDSGTWSKGGGSAGEAGAAGSALDGGPTAASVEREPPDA
jgi:hypothetical protein